MPLGKKLYDILQEGQSEAKGGLRQKFVKCFVRRAPLGKKFGNILLEGRPKAKNFQICY